MGGESTKPIRFVVDSSALRSTLLREILAESRSNLAVVTEVTAFEPYRNSRHDAIAKNLEILCQFPDQVIVLRGMGDLVALERSRPATADEFVDASQTLGHREFCAGLELARAGEPHLRGQLDAHIAAAHQRHRHASEGAALVGQAMRGLLTTFSTDELSAIRRGAPYPPRVLERTWSLVRDLTADAFAQFYPGDDISVESKEGTDRLLFRIAAVGAVEVLWWARNSGLDSVSSEKLTNSLFDAYQVAVATKFDLLLANDKKMNEIYTEAGALITVVQDLFK